MTKMGADAEGLLGDVEDRAESAPALIRMSHMTVVVVMTLLVAATILVRVPHLDEPMGLHHEEGTARTLVHSLAWWNDGPTARGYLLRMTLDSPGDKYLSSPSMMDDAGNTYYYSLPPGHPLSMFLPHRIVGIEPTVLSVRLLNVVLHIVTGIMVYLIAAELLRGLPGDWRRFAGVAAFALYMFAPISMWYQSNSYTSASAVQPWFVAGVLVAARAYRSEANRTRSTVLMAGVVFLMAYTEWLGLAFAAVAVGIALLRRKDRVARRLALGAAVGAAAALALVVFQYAEFIGFSGVTDVFLSRYGARSGFSGQSTWTITSIDSWVRFAKIYGSSLGPALWVMLFLWIWDRIASVGRPSRFRAGQAPAPVVFAFAAAPVLLHHLVLFDHAVAHDFDMLKAALPVSLACGYLIARQLARSAGWTSTARTAAVMTLVGAVLVASGASISLFEYVNARRGPDTIQYGRVVAEMTEPEEVVFLQFPQYVPTKVMTFYARRNFTYWKGPESAVPVLEGVGGRTGILFVFDPLGTYRVSYVGRDGLAYETREKARSAPSVSR